VEELALTGRYAFMTSSTSAASALPGSASPLAVVIGGDSSARGEISRLLRDAGFSPCATPEPGALAVVLGQGREEMRLREVRTLADAPDAPILVVMPADVPNAALRRVLLAGAIGIVFEDDLERALVPAARAVLAGQLTVPSILAQQIAPRPLSYREKQILAFVALGMTNREIANRLFLAESTVKTHLSSAFRKIDACSRSEAVARIQDPDSQFGFGVLAVPNGVGG
jgi:DNA-binding NarL/FixJ family response regulator